MAADAANEITFQQYIGTKGGVAGAVDNGNIGDQRTGGAMGLRQPFFCGGMNIQK